MKMASLLLCLVLVGTTAASPVGWEQWLADNIDEFDNIQLEWDDANKVPAWLDGTYMKNGPARTSFGQGQRSYQNQIDGAAKIHKFHVSKEGVMFSAKFLNTSVYHQNVDANDLVPQATLGPINPNGWPITQMRQVQENEIMNTDVTIDRMGDEFIASTDLNKVNVFDPKTLKLKEFIDPFGKTPFGQMRLASCAHWRKDINSNDMFNYDVTWIPAAFGQFLRLYRFPNGNLRAPQEVNSRQYKLPFQTLVHYFSVTEHYAVFFLYPIHMAIPKAVFDDTPMQDMLEHVVWEGDRKKTQIMIIDLETGELLKPWRGSRTSSLATLPPDFPSQGFYGTHHVNAYESVETRCTANQTEPCHNVDPVVVTDVVIPPHYALQNYTDRTVLLESVDEDEATSTPFNIIRFTTSLTTFETRAENWNDLFPVSPDRAFVNQFDFPKVNPNYAGKDYCFAYGQSMVNFQRHYLVKKDLCGGPDLVWYKEHHYSGEPYFVPNPNGESEDDGVILNVVLNGYTKKSYLLILDAKTMTELTVAKLDTHIPMSIHGVWIHGEKY